MNTFLKNHPFAIEAFFKCSVVLSFAVPKEQLKKLVPECLQLDVFDDKWAFIAVALVQTRDLRPKGFPRFMGNDFFLIGYRVFVRYTDDKGKRLRGLFILKSETDKKKMQYLGNLFTHYRYTTTDIALAEENEVLGIVSNHSGLRIKIKPGNEQTALPAGSPFRNWAEARRFAGPLPFTFTYTPQTKKMLIIEGVRQNWKPQPVSVIHQSVGFIESLGLPEIHLANAFIVKDISYHWKKGKKEIWKG